MSVGKLCITHHIYERLNCHEKNYNHSHIVDLILIDRPPVLWEVLLKKMYPKNVHGICGSLLSGLVSLWRVASNNHDIIKIHTYTDSLLKTQQYNYMLPMPIVVFLLIGIISALFICHCSWFWNWILVVWLGACGQ